MINLPDPSHLRGGGAMGALIRCKDWSRTPLGTLESWPLSLMTAASLILGAQSRVGFDSHLTKPVDIDKVQRVLSAKFRHEVREARCSIWSRFPDRSMFQII